MLNSALEILQQAETILNNELIPKDSFHWMLTYYCQAEMALKLKKVDQVSQFINKILPFLQLHAEFNRRFSAGVYTLQATIYELQNQPVLQIQALEKSLELVKASDLGWRWLAEAYFLLGRANFYQSNFLISYQHLSLSREFFIKKQLKNDLS